MTRKKYKKKSHKKHRTSPWVKAVTLYSRQHNVPLKTAMIRLSKH